MVFPSDHGNSKRKANLGKSIGKRKFRDTQYIGRVWLNFPSVGGHSIFDSIPQDNTELLHVYEASLLI